MNNIDITAIAQNLTATYPTLPTGTSTRNGGEAAAETIESLIDDAAQAGAFADLADRPSIEVSTLTHADHTIWIALEFDRDHKLLRAGPVPIAELTEAEAEAAEDAAIAGILTRIRQLLATAIVLGTPRPAKPMRITVAQRPRAGRLPMLALTGPALREVVLDTARTVALDAVEHPDGAARRLGKALSDWQTNQPTRAQSAGPDPLPPASEATLDQIEEAEEDLAELTGPARLNLNLHGAAALVGGIVQAVASIGREVPTDGPSDIALACAKRRQQSEDILMSVRAAQRFVNDLTCAAAQDEAAGPRRRVAEIHATAVQSFTIAMMLSEMAEQADLHGEQYAALAAELAAASFEHSLTHAENDAWDTAATALCRLVEPEHRAAEVGGWERSTGRSFPVDWRQERTA